jgi:hypothetical protein
MFRSCRAALCFITLFALATVSSSLAATNSQRPTPQGASGITWAQQAMQALTGGNPVSSVTESGSVTAQLGGNQGQGSISLGSTGLMTNQLTLTISAGQLSESRSWDGSNPSGQWTGLDGRVHQMAQQNCWTDAVWFFPAMSLLSDYLDPNLTFIDLGQVQYSGGAAEHIQVYRSFSFLPPDVQEQMQALTTVDFYLNSQTALPIAMSFASHGDQNINASIPVAIVFSQYQSVNGVQVPYQVVQLVNGSPFFQISITNAVVTGQNLPAHK